MENNLESIGQWWMWTGFAVFVLIAVAIDLLVMRAQGAHKVSVKEAVVWSIIWIGCALIFCAGLWWYLETTVSVELANTKASEFLTGYLIEKSLSVDNIFVFLMIFSYFSVPIQYQKRILIIGIVGAIVLRAIMILLGAILIAKFHWVLYIFGIFLLITGIKMLIFADESPDLEKNPVLKWMRGHLNILQDFRGEAIVVSENGKRWFTPLFVVIILIAITDIIFAVDSIPAIYALTEDPFIVMTANIFAILGLRALYFLLADMKDRFHLLSYGLAFILIFVGTKMLVVEWIKLSAFMSLGVVVSILLASIGLSLYIPKESPIK